MYHHGYDRPQQQLENHSNSTGVCKTEYASRRSWECLNLLLPGLGLSELTPDLQQNKTVVKKPEIFNQSWKINTFF